MSDQTNEASRALEVLADLIADRVVGRIAARLDAKREDDLVFVNDAATFGLTPRVLADAIRRGDVDAIRCGRRNAVKRGDLLRWRDSRAVRPTRRTEPANDHATSLEDDVAAAFERMTASR